MRSVTFLFALGFIAPALAGQSSLSYLLHADGIAPVSPMLFTKDPMSVHKRSQPSENTCVGVCGVQKIEGVHNEREALCSFEGLQATRTFPTPLEIVMLKGTSGMRTVYRYHLARHYLRGQRYGRVRADS